MSVTYNGLHVDERYSAILEPNLYFNPILVPGVTCTDKYETGPAGQIFVHQLNTSAVEAGTPGRDFTDEVAADTLIPIQINNNFQKSKKIYGVQAAAVSFAAGNEYLATAMGPNVPLHEGGQLVGFFSPKAPKKYTGKKLQFHGAPKRGARWFDRMKRVHTADIVAEANRAYRGGRVL